MTDVRFYPAQYGAVQRVTEGFGYIPGRSTRDGALFVADWKQSLIMDGRGFTVMVGSVSTPITGGGNGTTIDTTEPEFAIAVPDGTAIMPIRVHVQTQSPLIAADNDETEILLGVDRTQVIAGGTATTETAFNLRTDNPRATTCTCTSAYTADSSTTLALGIELAHAVKVADVQGTAATALWTQHELLYVPADGVIPIIMGPATLVGFWGGTVATTGFAQVSWLELPESAFS